MKLFVSLAPESFWARWLASPVLLHSSWNSTCSWNCPFTLISRMSSTGLSSSSLSGWQFWVHTFLPIPIRRRLSPQHSRVYSLLNSTCCVISIRELGKLIYCPIKFRKFGRIMRILMTMRLGVDSSSSFSSVLAAWVLKSFSFQMQPCFCLCALASAFPQKMMLCWRFLLILKKMLLAEAFW